MAEIVTACYDSPDKIKNAYDDLIATGIPSEKIRINAEQTEIQVDIPTTIEPEIMEILQRHEPSGFN